MGETKIMVSKRMNEDMRLTSKMTSLDLSIKRGFNLLPESTFYQNGFSGSQKIDKTSTGELNSTGKKGMTGAKSMQVLPPLGKGMQRNNSSTL